MSDRDTRAYRYGGIKRQLQRGMNEHERHLRQAWVERVLALLDSDNLITQATSGQAATEYGLLFECNVAPEVWDDPRVAYRRQQLERNDITVDMIDHQFEVAGKTFKRTKIRVVFGE